MFHKLAEGYVKMVLGLKKPERHSKVLIDILERRLVTFFGLGCLSGLGISMILFTIEKLIR